MSNEYVVQLAVKKDDYDEDGIHCGKMFAIEVDENGNAVRYLSLAEIRRIMSGALKYLESPEAEEDWMEWVLEESFLPPEEGDGDEGE